MESKGKNDKKLRLGEKRSKRESTKARENKKKGRNRRLNLFAKERENVECIEVKLSVILLMYKSSSFAIKMISLLFQAPLQVSSKPTRMFFLSSYPRAYHLFEGLRTISTLCPGSHPY